MIFSINHLNELLILNLDHLQVNPNKDHDEYFDLWNSLDEWINDEEVIEASKKDGNDKFWVTTKGFILEKHHSRQEEWFDYKYVEPFVIERIAEGAYSDPENINWSAEAKVFRTWLTEESFNEANREFSRLHMDFTSYLANEVSYEIEWQYGELIKK